MGKAAAKVAAKVAASLGTVKVVEAQGLSATLPGSVLSASVIGIQKEAVSVQAVGTNSTSCERSHSEISGPNRSSKRIDRGLAVQRFSGFSGLAV